MSARRSYERSGECSYVNHRRGLAAGLAQATVVVEARERSGALITVDLALEEGREVFAVPGEITSVLSAFLDDLFAPIPVG